MTRRGYPTSRVLGILRTAEGKGVVRIEDRVDTRPDDLWSALTDPRRLARWLGEVEGDLQLGGVFAPTSSQAAGKEPGKSTCASRPTGCGC